MSEEIDEEIAFSDALVNVNILNYTEDDADDCFLHQASRHDEDANKVAAVWGGTHARNA